jgi:long-chain acyl-CoA synthetase
MMNLSEMPLENELTFTRFDRMSERYPDRTAVVYLGQHFSFAQLREMSERFGGALLDMGIEKGDRVMIYISNCIQWIVSFLGIQKIGAVIVPVAPIYTSYEIEYMVNDSGAETIICLDTNFCYVKDIFDKTGLKRAIVTNLVDLMPLWKRSLGLLFDKIPAGKVDKETWVYRFKPLLQHPPMKTAIPMDPWKDLSYILYTGGTTGFPKGVPGNHIGMTSYVNDVTEDVAGSRLKEGEDVYIAINPLFHIMALGLFMSLGLNKGNTTLLMPAPQIDAVLETIHRYKARWLLGVPALYRMILENDRLDRYDLSSIAYCICGGDVLPLEVFRRWKERFNVPIYQVYGSTEAGHVTYSRLDKEPSPTTVGLPLKSRACIIVNPETLEKVPKGESGELLVTSPYTMKAYWKKPEETTRSYVEIDGEIYYRMGDFVREEADGELVYVERSADIIKHKAYRVSASEIEAVLQDHPTVIGACAVGVPDAKVGERVKAIVVLKEDARGVGGTELIKWCRERLASYKVPSYIEFRDMLPKSKVGKLLRREIRDEERRRISEEDHDRRGTSPLQDDYRERSEEMDVFEAIKERRSCRNFSTEAIDEGMINQILEAATWAPSPLNSQPWKFLVITSQEIKDKIYAEAERCRQWALETSGWKWLGGYKPDFLKTAPVMIVVVGDPKGTGVDQFQEEGSVGYQHACAAAAQNILLAAHAMGLGSLWFTFFDKGPMRDILGIEPDKIPLALICLGKAAGEPDQTPRKGLEKKVTFMR